MIRRFKERNFHFIIVAFLCGLFVGINLSFLHSATEPSHKYLDYFHQVYQIIRTDYVEEPQTKELFFGAMRGMIKALDDPFSRFLDEKAYEDLREMTTGKFIGVGVEISQRDDEVVIIAPIEDSPAMRAGILPGDIIAKINGKTIRGMKLEEVIKMIKGIPNSKVKITVRRKNYDDLFEFEVERAPIKIKSVEYGIMAESAIGYLRIKNFGTDTTGDVIEALKFFNKKNIGRLILDLRNNPGGLFNSAIDIGQLFIDKGKTIVSTRGREGVDKERIHKSQEDSLYKGGVIVLVNNGSASASEILAGAIRDNQRGKLIGVKTFGKGSVQKSYNLADDIGVAITIARYYTPSGEMIHKRGITPDYKVPTEDLSAADRESSREIERKKILEKFINNDMDYNDVMVKRFQLFLKNNGITLSERAMRYILKSSLLRYKKRPLYDLEFDNQLVEALKKIGQG